MSNNNSVKGTGSQDFFVPLQQENINSNNYGTDINGGAGKAASEHYDEDGRERLGLHSRAERGRPTLGNRWDTLPYEEGLWTVEAGDKLGSPQPSVRQESKRLIDVAKAMGDYIPSTVWETCGKKVEAPSAESVVFTDEEHGRVVKFKDPFVPCFKNDSHLEALYNHHVHNRFFGNAAYRFLGVSQDPNSGGARFVFEQPFIDSKQRPSMDEMHAWFEERGFRQTDDKFWYTDDYVSFTDIFDNDNCLKDKDGNLYFIDPMIKFDRPVKEIISHYKDMDRELDTKLERAGIGVGSRFRIDGYSSSMDLEVKGIDYGGQRLVFGPLSSNTDPYYQREFSHPVDTVLSDFIKLEHHPRWIQTDENRQDVVVSAAKQAILDRVKDPTPHASFTDSQIKALDRYFSLHSDQMLKEDVFSSLVVDMKKELSETRVPDAWVKDMREELVALAHGERREASEGLRR